MCSQFLIQLISYMHLITAGDHENEYVLSRGSSCPSIYVIVLQGLIGRYLLSCRDKSVFTISYTVDFLYAPEHSRGQFKKIQFLVKGGTSVECRISFLVQVVVGSKQ